MVCKECGTVISEGRMYCDACLGDIGAEQPEVITMSRSDVMRAEKKMRTQLDLVGFVKALPKKNMRLIMFFGALLTYISPFLAWLSKSFATVNAEKKKHFASLFDLGGKKDAMALGNGAITIVALVVMVAGIMMLICSTKDYTPIADAFNSRIMRYLPIVLTVYAVVKFFITSSVRTAIKASARPSYGFVICVVGLIMYSIAIIAEEKAQ